MVYWMVYVDGRLQWGVLPQQTEEGVGGSEVKAWQRGYWWQQEAQLGTLLRYTEQLSCFVKYGLTPSIPTKQNKAPKKI